MFDESLFDAIYAIATDRGTLTDLLAILADRYGCISAAFIYHDKFGRGIEIAIGYGVFDAEVQARYLARYAAIDPALAVTAALPLGAATATSRLFDHEESGYFRVLSEFYHPLGLCEALAAPIARKEERSGIVTLHRGRDRSSFTDEDVKEFGAIALHIARAMAQRKEMLDLTQAVERREGMLDSVKVGVLAVERNGRLVEANSAGRAILERRDGLLLSRSGKLRAGDKAADGLLHQAIATTFSKSQIVLVPRGFDVRPYALKVACDKQLSWAIVRVTEGNTPGDIEDILVQALRLSPSSAALIAALMRGDDVRIHAKHAGISENTVKFHLKSAFRATGTRRQIELIQLATATVRDLSD